MRNFFIVSFFVFLLPHPLFAQADFPTTNKSLRVAIFAPLYLDSAFAGTQLKQDKSIPSYTIAGADFIQGAQIALDTLDLKGHAVEAHIFDSKSLSDPVLSLINSRKLDSMNLIIGSVKEPEYSYLARFAKERGIPFVSATYPNDGRMRQNPSLMIMNSTLKTHCEGIFNYILQKHGTDNIYLFKKKNDNRIDNYFKEINWVDGKPLLKIRTIMLDSSVSPIGLRYLIDTTKPVVIIGASLDQTFSEKLAEACYPVQKTTPLVLIGMPNWDGFTGFYKKDAYKDFPIRYTSPHYEVKSNGFKEYLSNNYFRLYRTEPSDMAEKGFESTYGFVSVLINHPTSFMDHINDTLYAPLHDFNFRPVSFEKNTAVTDYYENKHLFIMQILNGAVSREW